MNSPEITIKIKEPLCSIFKDDHFDHFTIIQLRTAFMLELKDKTTEKEARGIVYRQVLRLQRKGLFSKNEAVNARHSTYSKTPLFTKVNLVSNVKNNNKIKINLVENSSASERVTNAVPINKLKEQLKECKVDLLSSISESSEYIQLISAYPTAQNYLQTQYHNACEQ